MRDVALHLRSVAVVSAILIGSAVNAQPTISGVRSPRGVSPGDAPLGRDSVLGSLDAQWTTIEGEGFGDDAVVRLRAVGVDAFIEQDGRLRRRPPDRVDVLATFGTEADLWTVEVMSGGETSAPHPFRIVPPRPVIGDADVVNGGERRSTYHLRLLGPAYSEASSVVVNGVEVESRPIKSSDYDGALTVGLEAVVSATAFENGRASVRVRTPGAAGDGLSEPVVVVLPPVPLRSRPEVWLGLVVGLVLLGVLGYRGGVRRARARARHARLEQEVAERTAALSEALSVQRVQADALRKATDQRARVFAGLAHDLRTPLSVVLASLENVLARDAVDAEERNEVEAALRAAHQLGRLATSLSVAAEHEAGEIRLSLGPQDVTAAARDAAAAHHLAFRARDVSVRVDAEGPIWAEADPSALQRILTNLLDNAGKFTPAGGSVVVSVSREGAFVVIAVADTGPGFPPAFVEDAFKPYVQGSEVTASRQGLGLGLSVVRDLVLRHRGTVRAEPGPGGTVTVALPATELRPLPLSERGDDAAVPGAEHVEVLVVEDDLELRDLLVRTLASEFRVEAVADGAAGLGAAERLRPAVIVSDVRMPHMDGLELVRALRAAPWGRDIPVVLVTALDAVAHVLTAFEAGADDYVVKPFDRAVLLARVRRLAGGRLPSISPLGPRSQPTIQSEDARLIETARASVEAALDDPDFQVAELAQAVGLSVSQLGRRLKEAADTTPAKLIESIRLDHAAALLAAKAGRVKEVAGWVGYRDVRSFSRAFRRAYGVAPSTWGRER